MYIITEIGTLVWQSSVFLGRQKVTYNVPLLQKAVAGKKANRNDGRRGLEMIKTATSKLSRTQREMVALAAGPWHAAAYAPRLLALSRQLRPG